MNQIIASFIVRLYQCQSSPRSFFAHPLCSLVESATCLVPVDDSVNTTYYISVLNIQLRTGSSIAQHTSHNITNIVNIVMSSALSS